MAGNGSLFDLGGRVAVVPGGNGGIGRSIALGWAEVRVMAGFPPRFKSIQLAELFGEAEAAATLDSRARGSQLTVAPVNSQNGRVCRPGSACRGAFEFAAKHV